MKEEFEATVLRVHMGEDDRWQGKPLYEAIVDKCRELGILEVSVYRGIEGFGGSTRIRHKSHSIFSKDAPIQVSAVDTEEKIARLIPHLDEMVHEGLIAISRVDAIRFWRER